MGFPPIAISPNANITDAAEQGREQDDAGQQRQKACRQRRDAMMEEHGDDEQELEEGVQLA
jgi:hypothetical protein